MKILWAIDCFGGSQSSIRAGAQFLSKLAQSTKGHLTIFPTAVMGPLEFQWFIDAGIKDSPLHYLEKTLRKFKVSGLQYPKVLSDSGFSLSASAKALDAFGKKQKCDLILCMTRSKPGVKSLVLGSFAESLIAKSKTSVFVVRPENVSAFKTDRVLFSTDLSTTSKLAFKKLLPIARALKSQPSVIHCSFQQSDWAAALAMVESFQYLSGLPFDLQEGNFKKDQKWFEQTARTERLKAQFRVSKSYLNVADEVLRIAGKEKSGYLALTTHSGPISAAFLGSVARRIVRLSSRPVLVLK